MKNFICWIALTRRFNNGANLDTDTIKKAKKWILFTKLSEVAKKRIINKEINNIKKYSKNILGKFDNVKIDVKDLKYLSEAFV